ncbi:MAG: nucleoside kinase [Eubacteriales bacterium]|nr:nucleoside kinase [Eubacteriales bacterium]
MMHIRTIEEINRTVQAGAEGMRIFDAGYAAGVRAIAHSIYEQRHEKNVILVSGPSGSGKTTTSHMIEAVLDSMGAETHTISMDNYFSPFTPEQKRLADEGKIDFESPDRLDIPFMNEQLEAMSRHKPIHLPIYDFKNSARLFREEEFCMREGDIVLLEGIHSLNPAVILLPESSLTNIYISVRTRVDIGGKLLHPSYIRLLRRMIRDRFSRARTLEDTLAMFEGVEKGEVAYIAPYKTRAHYEIDSFHDYELPLYHAILGEELEQFAGDPRMDYVRRALSEALIGDPSAVPEASLIREFIGQTEA